MGGGVKKRFCTKFSSCPVNYTITQTNDPYGGYPLQVVTLPHMHVLMRVYARICSFRTSRMHLCRENNIKLHVCRENTHRYQEQAAAYRTTSESRCLWSCFTFHARSAGLRDMKCHFMYSSHDNNLIFLEIMAHVRLGLAYS